MRSKPGERNANERVDVMIAVRNLSSCACVHFVAVCLAVNGVRELCPGSYTHIWRLWFVVAPQHMKSYERMGSAMLDCLGECVGWRWGVRAVWAAAPFYYQPGLGLMHAHCHPAYVPVHKPARRAPGATTSGPAGRRLPALARARQRFKDQPTPPPPPSPPTDLPRAMHS